MANPINNLPIPAREFSLNKFNEDVAATEEAKEDAQTAAGTKYREPTWAELSAVSGLAGEGGRVPDTDTGMHTDPITGDEVPNAGFYTWAADGLGSAQAKWVSDTGLNRKVDFADGMAKVDGPQWSAIAMGGSEVLGYDAQGRAYIRLAPWSLDRLGTVSRSSFNGRPIVSAPDGTEIVGLDNQDRLRFIPSPMVVRQLSNAFSEDFDAETFGLSPSPDIAIWGTSLSARGGDIVSGVENAKLKVWEALAEEIGRDVFNGAVGGTDSYAISIRQGGRDFPCTLSGGQLPADTTAVALTDWGGHDAYNNQTDQFRYGTLSGIPCILRRLSDEADITVTTGWTVERQEAASSATAIPDGTPFIFDDAVENVGRTHIFEAARNDLYDTREQITAQRDNIVSMCEYAATAVASPRFLVIGPWPATYEPIGSSGRTKAERRRTEMKKAFGPNFVDLWDYMVEWAIYDIGMTPTADDLTDISDGIIPRSLMDDNVHPNAAGNRALAREYKRQIIARGW